MNSTINLGFISIHFYSLFLFIAMIIGSFLVIKEAKKQNINENFIINLLFYAIIFGIIGARIYFVLFHLDYYSRNPLDIFKIWEGGLAIHGGIIAGLITIYIYCHKYKIKMLKILDILVVGLIIAQAIGRWGNFFNGEAHGPVTTFEFLSSLHLPDFIINGMYINGVYYIPTFLFESILCLVGFIILLLLRRRKNNKIGQLTSFYLIWYGIIRFFIESLRTDSLMFFSLKIAQIVSIIMIISGIVILIKSRKNSLYKEDKHV